MRPATKGISGARNTRRTAGNRQQDNHIHFLLTDTTYPNSLGYDIIADKLNSCLQVFTMMEHITITINHCEITIRNVERFNHRSKTCYFSKRKKQISNYLQYSENKESVLTHVILVYILDSANIALVLCCSFITIPIITTYIDVYRTVNCHKLHQYGQTASTNVPFIINHSSSRSLSR